MDPLTLAVDKSGRVILPKRLREHFRLHPGSKLEVEIHEDYVLLKPIATEASLVLRDGWWVHQGIPESDGRLLDAVDTHRQEHLDDLSR